MHMKFWACPNFRQPQNSIPTFFLKSDAYQLVFSCYKYADFIKSLFSDTVKVVLDLLFILQRSERELIDSYYVHKSDSTGSFSFSGIISGLFIPSKIDRWTIEIAWFSLFTDLVIIASVARLTASVSVK